MESTLLWKIPYRQEYKIDIPWNLLEVSENKPPKSI